MNLQILNFVVLDAVEKNYYPQTIKTLTYFEAYSVVHVVCMSIL